ncbi:MAG: hypothetical protein ACREPR_01970 [Brasilonema sp.]
MLLRKLVTSSLLTLSIVSTAFFATTLPSYAGEGRCGDSFLPCKEPQNPKQPTSSIKYTVENKTEKTIRFTLPSGKIHQLTPGQRGSYHNTATTDRLRLFLIDESKFYPLKNGNYQFRQKSNGQILLTRTKTASRIQTRTLSHLPNRVGTRRNLADKTPQELGVQNPEPSVDSSDSIWSEIVHEIGGIVKTAITGNATAEQKPSESLNNQPTITDDQNSLVSDSQPSEPNTSTTSSLPEKPPEFAQSGDSVDQILATWLLQWKK